MLEKQKSSDIIYFLAWYCFVNETNRKEWKNEDKYSAEDSFGSLGSHSSYFDQLNLTYSA
jgi:hypothetical protein